MEPGKRPRISDGRILVSLFLALMGGLFTLTGLVFEPASPPRYTIFTVAALLFVGAGVGFTLALRRGGR